MLEKIEAKLVPPRKWLSAIVDDTDDEAVVKEKQEKALAEHVARHPEDAGRMVEDFNWILRVIMREAEALRAARAAGIALNGSGKATIGRSGMGKVMVKHKSVKIIKQFQSYLADTISALQQSLSLSTPPGSMNCTASTSTKAVKSKPKPT